MTNNLEYDNLQFSILMANYNNASYVEEAIKSVLSQTYSNWELVIVDDCSIDKSVQIIEKFLNGDRIKLIQHKFNKGYGSTLNTAAENASNQILAILDADDKLHPKALEIMINTYKNNPNCGFIYSTMWNCDSELKNCIENDWIGPVIPEKTNIFKIKVSHLKTFMKAAYLKTPGFDSSQKRAADKDIIFKLEEVTDFKFVDLPLYFYRWHGLGISQGKSGYIPEFYHYLAKLHAYRRRLNSGIPNFTKKQITFEYYRITFYKVIHFSLKLYNKLKIRFLVKKLGRKFSIIPKSIKPKLKFIKKLN